MKMTKGCDAVTSDRNSDVIKVVVIDDDPAFFTATTRAISASSDMHLLASATSLAEGLALLEGPAADVMVVDLGLPDGSGIDLIHAARIVWRNCDIMVATVFGDEAHVIGAIEAGATGYLLKDSQPSKLTAEIRSLHAGGSPISPIIARGLLLRLGPALAVTNPATTTTLSSLSKREEAVLDLITIGFSQSDVAAQLNVSQHTVRTFVRRIYLKLGVRTKSDAIMTARRLGILRVG
jgi:DNA-binding NarL/FixJ family response regulator